MVNLNLRYFLLISLFGLCSKCSNLLFAQNYTLSNWTVEDGLSSNDVNDILQDKNGFIWIATEHGLNQFDGYTFKKYRYNPSDSTSMGANFINNICQDGKDNIWVNLGVGVLSKYDRLTQKFTNYVFDDDNTFIFDLKYIPGLGMCVGTNQGLFKVDELTNQLISIDLNKKEESKSIFKIFPASNQRIYLCTKWGFELWNTNTNSTDSTYFIEELDTVGLKVFMNKFYEDLNGKIWVQTHSGYLCESDDGVYFRKSHFDEPENNNEPTGQLFISETRSNSKAFFSKSQKLWTQIDHSQSWSSFQNPPESIGFAFQDRAKTIWICTKENELLKWSGGEWQFILDLGGDLEYWQINNVFSDDKGGIWFATKGKGVWRIYNRKWPISGLKNSVNDELIDIEITVLKIDSEDYMWVGANENLYKYYFETGALVPLFSNSVQGNPLLGLSVNDIAQDENENICIATSQGVFITNETGNNYRWQKTYNINGEEWELDYTRSILHTNRGKTWIGTNQGLILYDSEKDIFDYFGLSESSDKRLNGLNIQCLKTVNDTSILVGYTKYGADLLTFSPLLNSFKAQKIVYQNSQMEQVEYATINTFYQDGSEFWAGSFSKGLLKIDLENLTMRPLSEDFPIIPNVKGIQKGTDGNLWVSSIDGLRSINPKDLTFYRFSKSSGLLSNHFSRDCAVQDSNGDLYFGNKNGLNKIEPSKWNNQDTIATPILTAFKKYDESITFDTYLNEVECINLSHQDDFITFEFISPTYDNPHDVQYAYQLEGFDSSWRYCENQMSATYTNLDPGEYFFKVQAGNKGGFLNSKTKLIQINVTPPFWQTSWFLILIIGLLIFAYWLVYRIQSQIRKNRLKTIAEIRQKAADDFHDELGHRLTKIGLFVESLMLQKDSFPEKSAHILQKIQDNANELYHSTKDFIWAINPSKDSAIELFILLRDFGNELFDETNIQFSAEGLNEEYKDYLLNMDLKRQLVLIFKEAMNNALKHSDCTKVVFEIEECKKDLKLSLTDNGCGFILNRQKLGYGLNSMLNRSKKVGGELKVDSKVGEGTKIIFKI